MPTATRENPMNNEDWMAHLVRALRVHDISTQEEAIAHFRQVNRIEDVLALLSGTLETEDARLKVRAIELMSHLEDRRAIEPLVYALNDSEKLVRQTAALALARIDFGSSVPHLLNRVDDDAWEVRRAIIHSLGEARNVEYYHHFATAMRDDIKWVRADAAWALGELRDVRAINLLLKALRDVDWQVRRAATNALVGLGEAAVLPLIGVLPFEEYGVQIFALEALGRIGSPSAFPAVLEMIEDDDIQTKRAAVAALGKIGVLEAVPALLPLLAHHDLPLRLSVLRSLGQLGDARAADAVLAILLADEAMLAMEAHKTALLLGDGMLPSLEKLLYSTERTRQQLAHQMLAAIGSPAARDIVNTWRKQDNEG